ncbi:acetyl-CoA carboxylase carboxyltransferase subunit beta [Campylobacter sp. Cr9]|uniref:acetyl-CoA carboxylase, carboxyltransferase subunit beta n=1 Tax=unclassified Campylobacter TaxID=2593542 RepID=UPI001EFC1030|nr:acetyl-CoA carboxylase, carboxyltransferase subunit beta [Campylobacter sp. RM5004]MBZ7984927.1 acetyl-CoA carboxylase carboxyltransferase subunit beta [Campylobacter sp. Cr9]ULO02203.1 acetyl-CoA carboxylase, carboxyltransferase, beta subunit [Campylobacter sp. RM5004]
MNFADIFNFRKAQPKPSEAPNHWVKCDNCHALMYYKEVASCFNVCPKCGLHMKISPKERIEMLVDEGSFIEYDKTLRANDPLKFVDSKSYKKRLSESEEKTGRTSAVISGECKIGGIGVQLCVFDFSFMGGSLGSVEGEKIVRAIQRAMEKKEGLIIISASGGARMQESTYSLMQMAKTSAALKLLARERLPYISILTNPTFGGVSASFAWLGDLVIAEPMAQIGFAGARVIKQTIGADLPEGFQSAEFLLEHGLIDAIVTRANQREFLSDFLRYFK